MPTEIEILGTILHLRDELKTGRAQAILRQADLSDTDVGRVIGVDSSTVCRYRSGERRPRRAVALRLSHLLSELEVVLDAR